MRLQSRHSTDTLARVFLGHHEKLMKMLEAMTTRQKITEARKEVDVNKDDGNDYCGPEIVGKVKSDYE